MTLDSMVNPNVGSTIRRSFTVHISSGNTLGILIHPKKDFGLSMGTSQ